MRALLNRRFLPAAYADKFINGYRRVLGDFIGPYVLGDLKQCVITAVLTLRL